MTKPKRSTDQIAVSLSMKRSLRDQIDQRAEKLGLNRSQYLAILARADIAEGGEFAINETSVEYTTKTNN